MQFQVPQFLEVEDKLFGSFTFRQFIYLAGGAAGAYLVYSRTPIWIAVPVDLLLIPFAISLAFIKVNNKPFAHFVESFFRYAANSRLYIWKKIPKKIERANGGEAEEKKKGHSPQIYATRLSENKLKELAWTLNVRSHKDGGVV